MVGVLAVELFERTDGALLVNELAMRPHNCGHWTIEGARTSQFEQHLRAVLDYPLGATGAGRAGRGDGERAGRAGPGRARPGSTSGCTTCPPAGRRLKSTCTASSPGRAARSATSPRSGDDLAALRRDATAAAAYLATGLSDEVRH